MFSNLPEANFNFLVTFILSSANAFNLYKSKILLFVKELSPLVREHRLNNLPYIISEVNEEQGGTSLPGSESLLADTKEIFEVKKLRMLHLSISLLDSLVN